ncbi:MAG: M4 family metallopeptidase [Microbacterium sp.]
MKFDDRPDFKLLHRETQEALSKLAEESADGPDSVDFSGDLVTGRLTFLSGRFGGSRTSPEKGARAFVAENSALFGIEPDGAGLGEPIVTKGRSGSVVVMPQLVDGIRAYGSGLKVELDRRGAVTAVCGRLVNGEGARRKPELSKADAVTAAREALGVRESVEFNPELVLSDVYVDTEDPDFGRLRPAWLVTIDGPEGTVDVLSSSALETPVVVTTTDGPGDVYSSDVPLVHVNDITGVPDFVTFGPNGTRTSGSASGDPRRAALAFFSDHPLMFATGDVPIQLQVSAVQRDPGAPFQTHVILQQTYAGLEVLGAQLRVHLTPSLNVTSISGNYLRDPRVVPEPTVLQFDARTTAVARIAQVRTQHGIPEDPAKDVEDGGIVLFPGELSRAPYARNAVAWRFRFPEATVLVDARSDEIHGGLLFVYPHRLGADRDIYDAGGAGEISFPMHVMKNSTPTPGTTQNPEVAPADAFITAVLAFYTGLGQASWDNKDSPAEIVTNSTFTITTTAGAHWDIVRQQAWFQTGQISAWLVGHEFTHGVTAATAFLMPIDEPGALNEHYSDVMGGLVIRDLSGIRKTPASYSAYVPRSPACAAPEAVFSGMCDSGNVHTNNGIGNLAASLLGEGNGPVGTHTGIGFNRLARLFYETVTTRMHPWSTYIDERLNTWETARTLASRGVLVTDDTNSTATLNFTGVANEVSWAFTMVGVTPALIPGWYTVPGTPFGQHSGAVIPFWEGQFMPACTLVGDVETVVQLRDPIFPAHALPLWEGRSRVNGPGGGAVSFAGGVLGASILSHTIGNTDRPQPKDTVMTIFHSGFLPFEARPIIVPIDDPACPPPGVGAPGPRPNSDFVTPGITHWHDFLGGGKGTDRLNLSSLVREPGGLGCTIDLIELELLGRDGQILARTQPGQTPAVYRYGMFSEYSFGVSVVNSMIGTSDPGIDVRWWHDIGAAVRYRVHYYCTGDSCDIR